MSTETLSLHPLLVSKMRDKRTTKRTLNAGLLPGRPDMSDGFFRNDWALEMWRIGYKLAHESCQALDLFRSGCGYILIKRPDVAILKVGGRGIHTIRVTAYLHQTRADTHEEHTVFLVLRVELGHNDIHGCLGGSVQRTNINLTIIGQVSLGRQDQWKWKWLSWPCPSGQEGGRGGRGGCYQQHWSAIAAMKQPRPPRPCRSC